jgi:hypothetical protein
MTEIKWRFPGNGFTADTGLDTADMETFKKDAISSLARELCQNSIDAKDDKMEGPVKIVFKSFEISKSEIPSRQDLEDEIDACIDTWKDYQKISLQLLQMKEKICKDSINCLRISDFNTTGLLGVNKGDNTSWHNLVHGSGLSDKGATSGGSKGIGKFATFVTSDFNTVFYSTNTVDGETGYEGICKLCSAKHEDKPDKTQGIGYYGSSTMNLPIEGQFNLDADFNRNPDQYGSDIFVLGFKKPASWKSDIISKILDSFMVAIVYGSLEVTVDDIVICSDNLKDIVFDFSLINKKIRKSIVSQYMLLTDTKNRMEDTITIGDYGSAKLYLLEFEDNDDYATHDCVMIRYPYMKIKDIEKISVLPCSAMCIIENNKLNEILRNIENPQHTNWEFNRIDDLSERNEIKAIYSELREKIRTCIQNHLANSDDTQTDLEGAGDYLPIVNNDEPKGGHNKTIKVIDNAHIQKQKVQSKNQNLNASVDDTNGDGVEVDIINNEEEGDDEVISPSGRNYGNTGGMHGGDNNGSGQVDPNGHVGLKHAELRGMEYRFFCFNKAKRQYGVSFLSDYTESDVNFELYSIDEAGAKEKVVIEACNINGRMYEVQNDDSVQFSITRAERYNISLVTDQDEMFSGEVRIYAYR